MRSDLPERANPQAAPPINRRCLLQVGALAGWGLSLTGLEAAPADAAAPAIRSCILIFYYGGPSHLDTWDMKPEAPAEIRGEFRAIDTAAPGVRISEHMPRSARVMDRVALIRSMHHPMRNHNSAAVEALCGRQPLGGDLELLADTSQSFPCYGSVLTWLHGDRSLALPHVALPHVMQNVVKLPGQTAGFLGSTYEPYQVESDPNSAAFNPGQLTLPAALSVQRLENRDSLLRIIDRQFDLSERMARADLMRIPYSRAFALLRSERVRRAFDLAREPEPVRERYGRNRHGQSVLLARRLVEAGVRFVTVFDGISNGQDANWDSHQKVFSRHRDHLLPPADQAFAALVEDLDQRGLLEQTLVVAMGEFGRTPKINGDGGRDHWPDCYSVALAGGGVKGGFVYGASDAEGAYPAADPVSPGDLAATLFWRFGLDWSREMRDGTGRPFPAAEGEPIRKLFM
jgi:uncharacterized protein DUF1501